MLEIKQTMLVVLKDLFLFFQGLFIFKTANFHLQFFIFHLAVTAPTRMQRTRSDSPHSLAASSLRHTRPLVFLIFTGR